MTTSPSSTPLLILRPEPGADATARAAAELGFRAVVTPLFTISSVAWNPPDPALYDAVVLTSANALRYAGTRLDGYTGLPAFAVGPATAAAVVAAGFRSVTAGDRDAEALMAELARGPHRRLLHLCGEDRRTLKAGGVRVDAVPTYRAIPITALPFAAIMALRAEAVVMLHSPRAATLFADLAPRADIDAGTVRIVAISPAAATAAGTGWARVAIAPVPTDAAMLAIARALCQNPVR